MAAFVISRSSLNISFVFIEEPYHDSLVHLQALLVRSFFSQSFVFLRCNQGPSEDWRSQPDRAATWPGPPGRGPECRRAPQPLWASQAPESGSGASLSFLEVDAPKPRPASGPGGQHTWGGLGLGLEA